MKFLSPFSFGIFSSKISKIVLLSCIASVAQLVEQLICNQPVVGSSPIGGSFFVGEIPERPNGADCKSVARAS